MITVVGLGVKKGDLTENGRQAILSADKVIVRTACVPSYDSIKELGVDHTCLDDVYVRSRSYNTLYKNLANKVIESGDNVVYCVDGAASEDNSVKILIKKLKNKLNIIDGVSKISSLVRKAEFKGCSYMAVSAYELKESILTTPLVVYDMNDRDIAGDVTLLLTDKFGDDVKVKYIYEDTVKKIKLCDLMRQKDYNDSSAVVIEKIDVLNKKRFDTWDLKEIVERLRRPDGCPWDKVQTPESIKMNVIEEAYELVDAIDLKDDDKILEETGDILLQAVFHAVMKEEMGAFNFTDVTTGICNKLISRHTHIFGKDKATNEGDALNVWEKNKMIEKHQETYAQAVNDVPKCFPAVMRAQKVGKRAAKAGLDFISVKEAEDSLLSEIKEFDEAIKIGDSSNIEKELGDILFSCVNIGRKANCDCEKALKESTEKFAKRFTEAERHILADNKDVKELSLDEWEQYYQKAKNTLRGKNK